VVTVETEFSPAERDFYDQLEARADKSLEKMMADKVNYANALVLLLRLRQACNHPRLSEGNIDKDRDALAAETAAPKAAAEGDIDALADAFGGMGIKVKQCDMCLGDLTRMEVDAGFTRCGGCMDSLDKLNNESSPTQKKPKKKSRVSIVTEEIKIEKMGRRKQRNRKIVEDSDEEDDEEGDEEKSERRKPRGRRIIADSDDEEEQGSWLVPEDQRQSLGLGKAGGTDDEDADGGGDDVGSDDSDHPSEADNQGSDLDSFIVNDEEAKPKRSAGSEGDGDSDSDNDTFVSVSKVRSSQVTRRSESSSSGEDAASIAESELPSDADNSNSGSDDDTFPTLTSARLKLMAAQKKKKKAKGDSIMVSAKIREVISILRKEATEHKFIVFSQFTSMLDLIEPFLRGQPGLKSVRYDGKMDNTSREAALKALRTDPHTRVLLCSLKCGSLGLNLTAATRVIIVEPFWNPFVEEQAIDRVHRLTQTVDVVVYKLTVADTVEARILELQNKKRLLAEMTIEGGMKKNKNALKLGLKEILDLFKHDPRVDDGIKDPGVVGQDVRAMMPPARKAERQEHAVFGRRW
jgi:SNF2 family DNA or RNA helicase